MQQRQQQGLLRRRQVTAPAPGQRFSSISHALRIAARCLRQYSSCGHAHSLARRRHDLQLPTSQRHCAGVERAACQCRAAAPRPSAGPALAVGGLGRAAAALSGARVGSASHGVLREAASGGESVAPGQLLSLRAGEQMEQPFGSRPSPGTVKCGVELSLRSHPPYIGLTVLLGSQDNVTRSWPRGGTPS
jgi:hypothetical protein